MGSTGKLEDIQQAAEQGDVDAQYNLGVLYDKEAVVARDAQQEFDCYRKAKQAVAWYRKAADRGHALAQNSLGLMYANWWWGGKDQQAVAWFRKAADQGLAKAQYNLGLMYADCEWRGKDDQQAVAWYGKAAEQEDPDAQFSLGGMYANGVGVAKDSQQAVDWYRKAAEQGHATAQFSLGGMYANGEGVEKDAQQAVAWYRNAAEQEDPDAQFSLGGMYANGEGVEKDAQQAVAWYRKAAKQGNATAQTKLGWMYANGVGVAKDAQQAVAWYRKATRHTAQASFWSFAMKKTTAQILESGTVAGGTLESSITLPIQAAPILLWIDLDQAVSDDQKAIVDLLTNLDADFASVLEKICREVAKVCIDILGDDILGEADYAVYDADILSLVEWSSIRIGTAPRRQSWSMEGWSAWDNGDGFVVNFEGNSMRDWYANNGDVEECRHSPPE